MLSVHAGHRQLLQGPGSGRGDLVAGPLPAPPPRSAQRAHGRPDPEGVGSVQEQLELRRVRRVVLVLLRAAPHHSRGLRVESPQGSAAG